MPAFIDKATTWDPSGETNVYPVDSFHYTTHPDPILQDDEKRWVNMAYRNYPFKKYCSKQMAFIFPAALIEHWDGDTFAMANLLLDSLRKEGVSHFVAQQLYKKELCCLFIVRKK